MDDHLLAGISFGLTSATITTLGLMVGLEAGTGSKVAVLGGIFTIAIADAFSDALGMHVSQESQKNSHKAVWNATLATFVAKLLFALTFIIPVLFLELQTAMIVSIVWGFTVLSILSYFLARNRNEDWKSVVLEHLLIAGIVVFLTHQAGHLMKRVFI